MTFDKQVEKAKEKQLQSRITRDVVFIMLGLTFLVISIFLSIKQNNDKKEINKENKSITEVRK